MGKIPSTLFFTRKQSKTVDSIARLSESDAKKWKDFQFLYFKAISLFKKKLYELTPPGLPNAGIKEILGMRSMLGPISKHGTRGIVDLLRVAPMMMPELVDEWFDNELLRSFYCLFRNTPFIIWPFCSRNWLQPFASTRAWQMEFFIMLQFVKGGTEKFAIALKDCAESYGTLRFKLLRKFISIDTEPI